MRQKSHKEEEGNFQCLCCHVRTGSIILGIWHLVLHVFSVGILASVIFQPDVVNHMQNQWKDINGSTCCNNNEIMNQNLNFQLPELPKLNAGSSENYDFLKELKWELEDVRVALAVTLCKGFVTCLMIYGAVCGYSSYVMPFFCIQVFEFTLTIVSVIGYFSYGYILPSPRELINNSYIIPFKKELLQLDTQWMWVIFMMAFTFCIFVKAYCMSIVWSCYKFVKLLEIQKMVDKCLDLEGEILPLTGYKLQIKPPLYLSSFRQHPQTLHLQTVEGKIP